MAIQQKGSQFEREICVKMSEWVSGGTKKDIFWRTAMSGGRATVFKKKGALYRQSGDICAVAPEGHSLTDKYFFELKYYKDLNFPAFFVKSKGPLSEFWNKAQDEASSYNLIPILIVKQNMMPVLWIAQESKMPKYWVRNTHNFRIEVFHRRCTIYRFSDIVSTQYNINQRVRL